MLSVFDIKIGDASIIGIASMCSPVALIAGGGAKARKRGDPVDRGRPGSLQSQDCRQVRTCMVLFNFQSLGL